MSHVVRKFNTWVATLTCVVASVPALAAHKAPVQTDVAGVPPLTASALSDPLSPANPFNTGADPVSMPGDARMVVFPYSRDQIFRVMTAPLKLTTIELDPGEKLVSDPGLGDSVQWIIDTDGANHVFVKAGQGSTQTTQQHDMQFINDAKAQSATGEGFLAAGFVGQSRGCTLSPPGHIQVETIEGLNSDRPGTADLVVEQNVYDSLGNGCLMIPKGSTIVAPYNSDIHGCNERHEWCARLVAAR
jgi:type IV secretory pathway VirB10-like protein